MCDDRDARAELSFISVKRQAPVLAGHMQPAVSVELLCTSDMPGSLGSCQEPVDHAGGISSGQRQRGGCEIQKYIMTGDYLT